MVPGSKQQGLYQDSEYYMRRITGKDKVDVLGFWHPHLHTILRPDRREQIYLWLLLCQRLRLGKDLRLLVCEYIATV